MFSKILIANRGEIALRVIRAARELGIKTVAVHSTADVHSLHVRFADESLCIGPPPSKESYLNIPALLSAAEVSGADAIHPGYGFLSENAEFAEMVQHAGLGWIGPRPEMIRLMGNKIRAKEAMKEAGLPQLPGSEGVVKDDRELTRLAEKVGFPVILKAAAGGGGRGMKIVREKEQLPQMYRTASAEALAAFGNGDMYVERYVEHPRHIEIQIVADERGNIIHLGERECSVQRRHQKILEEAPSPALNERLRERMGRVAVEAMRKVRYNNVGTIEFLLDERGEFFFMEMNTRIQVEHPVTEAATGIDLLREQIRLAAGEDLGRTQKSSLMRGHAIEMRINAEDPALRALTRTHHRLPRTRRSRRARRLRRVRAVPGVALLRFDGGETHRHRRQPPGGDHARAARAAGVRRRGHKDQHSLAQEAPAVRAVRAGKVRHAHHRAAPRRARPDRGRRGGVALELTSGAAACAPLWAKKTRRDRGTNCRSSGILIGARLS
jgi:acetyl-CoA carboxylase biotin carboxylase subunit